MISPLLLCSVFRRTEVHGISFCWSLQVTVCNLRKQPLNWKHGLNLCRRVNCVMIASCTCSSWYIILLWLQRPSDIILGGIWEACVEPGWHAHRMECFLEVSIYRATDSLYCPVDKRQDELCFSEPQLAIWLELGCKPITWVTKQLNRKTSY